MTSKELNDKSIRIAREPETGRDAAGCSRYGDGVGCHNHLTATRHKDVGHLAYSYLEIFLVDVTLVLLIHVAPIGNAKAPPALRENLNAANQIDGLILEGIWSARAKLNGLAHLSNRLEVLVNRKVETNANEKFIRTVENDNITHRLGFLIAGEDRAGVH